MKKRTYKKVNTEKLTAEERKAYRKRLAYVRKYTRAKREWQKKIKAGTLDPKFPFAQYRSAKVGTVASAKEKESVLEASRAVKSESKMDDGIEILRRLFNELTETEVKQTELKERIRQIVPK